MAYLNDQTIQQLADALNGNERAQEWLQRQGRTDLIMVHDAIRFGSESAVEWLHENDHDDWGLFIIATEGDPYAVQCLFDGKQARMAMCAGAVIGDERAIEYLQKNHLKAWLNLVAAIKIINEQDQG
jgi:hypothetical protein